MCNSKVAHLRQAMPVPNNSWKKTNGHHSPQQGRDSSRVPDSKNWRGASPQSFFGGILCHLLVRRPLCCSTDSSSSFHYRLSSNSSSRCGNVPVNPRGRQDQSCPLADTMVGPKVRVVGRWYPSRAALQKDTNSYVLSVQAPWQLQFGLNVELLQNNNP